MKIFVVAAGLMLAVPAQAELPFARERVEWNQPQAPFHIIGNIYYVGMAGVSAFLIVTPKGDILTDGGLPEAAPFIEKNIQALGFKLHDVKILLSSHAHFDHSGGLARLKADTGAKFYASTGDKPFLESGHIPYGPSSLIDTTPIHVDHPVKDGDCPCRKRARFPGLWQIAVPEYVGVNIFHNAKFGPMRFIFCRIEEELEIHCVNGGFSRNGSVSADGNIVHIAWGTAMARLAIDGVRAGDTITGTFTFKLSGIAHDDQAPSISTRFSRPAPDAGGKTAYLSAVLGQLAENNLTLPHDEPAIVKNGGALPTNVQSFGTIQQISFLGNHPK